MSFTISAACGCHTGKIRKNNEDNFCFAGKHLELMNNGLRGPVAFETRATNGLSFAVFDGMGGENYGEYAALAAAVEMSRNRRSFSDSFLPEQKYLERLTRKLNCAVFGSANELCTAGMGSTMVMLYFTPPYVYACNVGDSRAYRLRGGELRQLSKDHVCEMRPGSVRKAPLSQHLGIDPEEMIVEPYIGKGELRKGDVYLLCSDGLTDMLTDEEIAGLLGKGGTETDKVNGLIGAALDRGGKDNVTVIVCRIL